MQYFLLWGCHKILFFYFIISLVISWACYSFFMHAYCFLSLGTVQLSCKGQSTAHRWGRRSHLKKLSTSLLPPSELLVPVTASWFVFPLARQYPWHRTDCGVTEMTGYFGEGSSFDRFCSVQYGSINYSFCRSERERERNRQGTDGRWLKLHKPALLLKPGCPRTTASGNFANIMVTDGLEE